MAEMEEQEAPQPAVVTEEDPDAPVTVEVTEADLASPATGEPEHQDQFHETDSQPGDAVVTDDPDAPVTVTMTAADVAWPAAEQPIHPESATDAEPLPQLTEEISAEQLLIDTPQPGRDDEVARKLAVLEAIVYVTDEPLSAEQIAKAMNESLPEVKDLLDRLTGEFNKPEHGLTVKEVAGGYKMATKPEHHEAVRTFVKNLNPPLKLSLAALETLAVIAYKQPITAPEIMEIRGVQGAGVLKTLIDRKLITTAGRKNVVGKPILYKTTKEFLVQFGLRDLNELPTLKEFEELRRMAFSEVDEPTPEPEQRPAPPAEPSPEPHE
jgi:segregation and condensation protein B